jgi:hypothetical protein
MHEKMGENPFWKDGLRFTCTSCGHCCRHEPGYVFLTHDDLSSLASFKRTTKKLFVKEFCRTVDLGIAVRLSLVETPENDCVFWSGGCSVYEARPLQCRTYPFWSALLGSRDEWDREALECPGMDNGELHSAEEIAELIAERESRTLISPDR